jgi:hypothetical protein
VVVVNGHDKVEELRSAPEETLSFIESIGEVSLRAPAWKFRGANLSFQRLAVNYTLGAETHYDPYHIQVVRGSLTRNIGNLYHELHEEIGLQFDSEIPLTKGQLFFLHRCLCFLKSMGQSGPKSRRTELCCK